jgi:glycosyltransferase involved in cell wall biosynthesis
MKDSLPKYIENPHIDEIVICDENGFDALQIKLHYSTCEKVKVYINDAPLGAGKNKMNAVSKAKNAWVALLDSDNFADTDYFTTWLSYVATHGIDPMTIYAPSVCHIKEGHANFDYSKQNNKVINRANFQKSYRDGLPEMILNTGNFIVYRDHYLRACPTYPAVLPLLNRNSPIEAFLKAGALIEYGMNYRVIPDMKWYHGINKESVYSQHDHLIDVDRPVVWAYFATITE